MKRLNIITYFSDYSKVDYKFIEETLFKMYDEIIKLTQDAINRCTSLIKDLHSTKDKNTRLEELNITKSKLSYILDLITNDYKSSRGMYNEYVLSLSNTFDLAKSRRENTLYKKYHEKIIIDDKSYDSEFYKTYKFIVKYINNKHLKKYVNGIYKDYRIWYLHTVNNQTYFIHLLKDIIIDNNLDCYIPENLDNK